MNMQEHQRIETAEAASAWPKGPIAALCLISLVSNLLMLVGPVFMLQVYDRILPSRSVPTLVALSLLVCGLYAFYALIELVRSRLTIRLGALADEAISAGLFRTIVFAARRTGGADPVRDLDSVRQFLSGPGPTALLDLPWLPLYLGLIYLMHPLLGWVTSAGAAAVAVLLLVNELFSRRLSQAVAQMFTRRQAQVEHARGGAEAIAAMGMVPALGVRWRQTSEELSRALTRAADRTAFFSSMTKASRFILQSAVLATGAYLVIRNESTAGLIIGASIVSSRALAPVEQVVAQWRGFVAARQAANRLRSILHEFAPAEAKLALPTPKQALAVDQLATGPTNAEKPVIWGVTFSLTAGDGLGVLGLSGSGKSSLARALVGVWPILGGSVRLDGSELAHFDEAELGRSIGYLPQSVELFGGTIGENISRFDPDAAAGSILAAAEAANIHSFITGLPDGYNTLIGERGAALSAGLRQRVGLARALYGDPFLIVLDEPNSNLDIDGDAALATALLNAKARGAIVVVVAHRPSAISAVDKLLYLQKGRQAAFGPKDEVLRQISNRPQMVKPRAEVIAENG